MHLTTHGFSNNMEEDRIRLVDQAEGAPNVIVNPEGVLAQVADYCKRCVRPMVSGFDLM